MKTYISEFLGVLAVCLVFCPQNVMAQEATTPSRSEAEGPLVSENAQTSENTESEIEVQPSSIPPEQLRRIMDWDPRDGDLSNRPSRWRSDLSIGFEYMFDVPVRFGAGVSRAEYLQRYSLMGDTTYDDGTQSGIVNYFTDSAIPGVSGPFSGNDSQDLPSLRVDYAWMREMGERSAEHESSFRLGPAIAASFAFPQSASASYRTFYASEAEWDSGQQINYNEHFGYTNAELSFWQLRLHAALRMQWESPVASDGSWWSFGAQAGPSLAIVHGDLSSNSWVESQGQNFTLYTSSTDRSSDSGFQFVPGAEASAKVEWGSQNARIGLMGGAFVPFTEADWETWNASATLYESGEPAFFAGMTLTLLF